MIVNRKIGTLESQGVGESSLMTIDTEGISRLMGHVSESIAKDPILYVCQEVLSNSVDSIWESGKDLLQNPVIVDIGNTEIKFIDKGVGIGEERIKIFTSFGKSTKQQSANELGNFGLGSKSPFAVSSFFTVESNFENVKRVWTIFKDGDERKYSLDFESITTEENGTIITVPISDKRSWRDKALEVCKYFKGVWVNGEDTFNNASLVEGKYFFWKKGYEEGDLTIVLGTVPYTINPRDLGLSHFYLPFAVKFGLDEGLFPTISRESIQLDKATIEKIKNRIKEALKEVLTYFKVPDFKNVIEYYRWKYHLYYLSFDFSGVQGVVSKSDIEKACKQFNIDLNIDCEKYQDVIPYVECISNHIFAITVKKFIKFSSGKFKDGYWNPTQYQNLIKDSPLGSLEKQFLKEKLKQDTLFIGKEKELEDEDIFSRISGFYHLSKEEQDALVARIKELHQEWWMSLEKTSDYNDEFLVWKKAKKVSRPTQRTKREKFDGQVSVKIGRCHAHNRDCVFDPHYKHLNEFKGSLCVYSTDKDELIDLWNITRLTNIKLVLVNKSETRHFENLSYMITAKEFKAGKKRISRKIVTAWFIQSEINKSKTLTSLMKLSDEIPFEVKRLKTEIKDYLKKYDSNGGTRFMEGLYQEYSEGNLLDYGILSVFNRFKKISLHYEGVDFFEKSSYYSSTLNNLPLFRELVILRKRNEINQRLLNKCKLCQRQKQV